MNSPVLLNARETVEDVIGKLNKKREMLISMYKEKTLSPQEAYQFLNSSFNEYSRTKLKMFRDLEPAAWIEYDIQVVNIHQRFREDLHLS
jgi:hypothetical protein